MLFVIITLFATLIGTSSALVPNTDAPPPPQPPPSPRISDSQRKQLLRFTSKEHSLLPSSSSSQLIHITFKDLHLTPEQFDTVNQWQALNPEFQVVLYNDDDMLQLVEKEYPEFLVLYKIVPSAVERVDIWRYLVVHSKGGLYADSDFVPRVPIKEWAHRLEGNDTLHSNYTQPEVILGWEGAHSDHFKERLQVLQWGFYSSKPRHPIFYKTVTHILDFFVDELLAVKMRGDAVARTGPEPFTWVVLRYLQEMQGNHLSLERMDGWKTVRANEVLVGALGHFDLEGSLAKHTYAGSWKGYDEKKLKDKFQKIADDYWNGNLVLA